MGLTYPHIPHIPSKTLIYIIYPHMGLIYPHIPSYTHMRVYEGTHMMGSTEKLSYGPFTEVRIQEVLSLLSKSFKIFRPTLFAPHISTYPGSVWFFLYDTYLGETGLVICTTNIQERSVCHQDCFVFNVHSQDPSVHRHSNRYI